MVSPLVNELGYLGVGDAANAITEGNYAVPPGCDDTTQAVLNSLEKYDNIPILHHTKLFSCIEYQQGWRKVKERKVSIHLGMYVGHWKCDSTDPSINWINTCMENVSFLSRYSPKQW